MEAELSMTLGPGWIEDTLLGLVHPSLRHFQVAVKGNINVM